jgi:hypothetical protein
MVMHTIRFSPQGVCEGGLPDLLWYFAPPPPPDFGPSKKLLALLTVMPMFLQRPNPMPVKKANFFPFDNFKIQM